MPRLRPRRPFITDSFLLETDASRELYETFAKNEPIYDFHCHLSPALIAANHQFGDLHEFWVAGDHYKWRAMRANGIAEAKCSGSAGALEKFEAWAATVPHTLGNPLYAWTHLELKRYFGVDGLFGPETASLVWKRAGAQLPSLRVHDILKRFKVAVVCTTDDPADPLDAHEAIRRSGLRTRVYPTFRPDRALQVDNPQVFLPWLEKLGATSRTTIRSFDDFLVALLRRHDAFHAFGGRLSDHGLETALGEPATEAQANAIFTAARKGRPVTPADRGRFGAYLMLEFGRWNAARGWAMQLHLGALRNSNARLLRELGPDTGYDSIGDFSQVQPLARFLDVLNDTKELPKTVLFNVNPSDNYAFASMAGNFQEGPALGKIQFGSGWWFLDQKQGMEWQLGALANVGLLSRFVGMVTDSRSFMSFPRHEYFRRVLCNLLGGQMERGELPDDRALVGDLVRRVSFANARSYFGLEVNPGFSASA